jgi:hypothetical protein
MSNKPILVATAIAAVASATALSANHSTRQVVQNLDFESVACQSAPVAGQSAASFKPCGGQPSQTYISAPAPAPYPESYDYNQSQPQATVRPAPASGTLQHYQTKVTEYAQGMGVRNPPTVVSDCSFDDRAQAQARVETNEIAVCSSVMVNDDYVLAHEVGHFATYQTDGGFDPDTQEQKADKLAVDYLASRRNRPALQAQANSGFTDDRYKWGATYAQSALKKMTR